MALNTFKGFQTPCIHPMTARFVNRFKLYRMFRRYREFKDRIDKLTSFKSQIELMEAGVIKTNLENKNNRALDVLNSYLHESLDGLFHIIKWIIAGHIKAYFKRYQSEWLELDSSDMTNSIFYDAICNRAFKKFDITKAVNDNHGTALFYNYISRAIWFEIKNLKAKELTVKMKEHSTKLYVNDDLEVEDINTDIQTKNTEFIHGIRKWLSRQLVTMTKTERKIAEYIIKTGDLECLYKFGSFSEVFPYQRDSYKNFLNILKQYT